jgi:arylsulfatase A-like enzyme
MPKDHSFDEFYGLPYSNDMYPLPMIRNGDVVQQTAAQASLTSNFTRQAVDFIQREDDRPFFLYFAHTAPHIPIVPAEEFRGKSGMGEYGDMVMEVDWSVGEILKALAEKGLDDNTLVVFTSDNGPWYQGSAGKLQGRKGSTYEGGVREPFVARFPGRIPGGSTAEGVGSAMDLLPTFARLAGATVPASTVDGVDIWDMLTGEKPFIERDPLLFFDRWDVQCVRWGPWKLHLARYNSYAWTVDPPGGRMNLPLRRPELYHVDDDPTESYDRAPEKSQLVADLKKRAEELMQSMPDDARRAWRDTFAQRVQETPVGALPAREGN